MDLINGINDEDLNWI